MISRPILPPKPGYVEVEVDGVRTYRNIKTNELIGNETPKTEGTDAEKIAALEQQIAEQQAIINALIGG